MKTQPIRIFTFSVFLLLIGMFVAYRAGAFDSMFGERYSLSDVHADNSTIALDTPGVKKDSLALKMDQQMMSSSKSMVIYTPPKQDTAKKKTTTTTPTTKPMMGGSKSAIIFEPKPNNNTTNNTNNTNKANQPAKPKN
jgi:hypothetical protein